jgi:L-tyrosine isonitrile synthase
MASVEVLLDEFNSNIVVDRDPQPAGGDSGQDTRRLRQGITFGEFKHLPKKAPPAQRQPKSDPDAVLKSFNTWAFKREQPSSPHLLVKAVTAAITAQRPLPFVLYWGKGPRSHVDAPDLACLDYLAAFAGRVGKTHAPGATIKLIFTDTHARLNGHAEQNMAAYFDAIDAVARARGFESCRLGQITDAYRCAADAAEDEMPSQAIQESLAACAAKWYRGGGTADQGALAYYRANMVERRAVELAFPDAIFITFNGSDFCELLPENLPIFHMYSLRRGVAVKPWFLPADSHEPTMTPAL